MLAASVSAAATCIPSNVPPVRAQVSEILREAIKQMHFKPGQRLVERELVELTGVSRTSIREALRELAAEGLVRSIPIKGMVVAGLTARETRELYELRSSLEGLVGRLFVQRATGAQVLALRRSLELIKQCAGQGMGLLEAKDEFYEILFDGAGNEALRTVVAGLLTRVRVMRSVSLAQTNRPIEAVSEIERIVTAIEARDADGATKACSHHAEQAGKYAAFAAVIFEEPGPEARLLQFWLHQA